MEQNKKQQTIAKLAVLLVIVLIVVGIVAFNKKGSKENDSTTDTNTPVTVQTSSETPAATSDTSTSTSSYKDGTYTATGEYSTPEDTEDITVTVTVKDGVVTDTSADASMKSRDSQEYAGAFVQNYKSQVVGKKLDLIKLSRVSGSSLTSQGFNTAIQQIKSQAKTSG